MANMALRFCYPWVLYIIFHRATSWVIRKRCAMKSVLFSCSMLIVYADALTIFVYYQGSSRLNSNVVKERAGEIDKWSLTAPVLRIITSFTSLVDSADFLEVSMSTFSSCHLHRAFGKIIVYLLLFWVSTFFFMPYA